MVLLEAHKVDSEPNGYCHSLLFPIETNIMNVNMICIVLLIKTHEHHLLPFVSLWMAVIVFLLGHDVFN